jgi:hypothetical protein
MLHRADRSRRRLAASALLGALVVLAAIPAYLAVTPAWRGVALRGACALLVAAGCARAARWVRRARVAGPISPLDAPSIPAPPVALDERFLALWDDVRFGTRSRRYFDRILWPRLMALAGRPLPRPADRLGIGRRGPSLASLDAVIAEIERRP